MWGMARTGITTLLQVRKLSQPAKCQPINGQLPESTRQRRVYGNSRQTCTSP